MREIPAEVLTLLKSRAMIGENKPTKEVTIKGLSSNFDWKESYTAYNPHTGNLDYHPSCAELSDLRLLYMYSRGNTLYQAYIADVDTFISQNGSVLSEQIVLNDIYNPRASLFKAPDGGLYFIVAYTQTTSVKTAKLEVYKSALGDGSDWALYSTINSTSWSTGPVIPAERLSVGIPYFIGNKWVLPHIDFFNSSGNLCGRLAISVSINNGLTWTKKATYSSGTAAAQYTNFGSRNIGRLKNELWWAWTGSYGTLYTHYVKSTDDGETWTEVFTTSVSDLYTVSFISDLSGIFAIAVNKSAPSKVYKAETIQSWNSFVQVTSLPVGDSTYYNNGLAAIEIGSILVVMSGSPDFGVKVLGTEILSLNVPSKSIGISHNKNMAGSLNVSIDNKDGVWSPDGTEHPNVLWPNAEITVKQGYGNNLVQTFSGLIDRVELSTFPAEIKLSIRDNLKLAIDQTITSGTNHVITYINQTIEAIFTDLCSKAGLAVGTVEATGLTLAEKTFSWESYGDCFQWLADLVGFEYICDDTGTISFRKESNTQPAADGEAVIVLAASGQLEHYPIVQYSEILTNGASTTYVRDTDYTIDYETGEIISLTIADGTIYADYVYAAYTFKEGEDIISLGYIIDDNDLYYEVVVYGKAEDDTVISASAVYGSRDYYNVLKQKVMKIDASEANTVEQCQAIANRAVELMNSKAREVNFAAIAVPWLQVGDVIRIIEKTTTISELYRITDISTVQDTNGYTMQMTCYHHSFA